MRLNRIGLFCWFIRAYRKIMSVCVVIVFPCVVLVDIYLNALRVDSQFVTKMCKLLVTLFILWLGLVGQVLLLRTAEKQRRDVPNTFDDGRKSKYNVETPGRSTAVVYLPEYGSIRYVKPPHFKESARILFWTNAYGTKGHWTEWWFNGHHMKNTCPGLKCHFTTDKKDLNISDAVMVMTYANAFNWKADVAKQLPPTRLPHQRWVFVMHEPPEVTVDPSPLNGLFNWTNTYRLDSDSVAHFGLVVLQRLPRHLVKASMTQDFSKGKTKLVAWLVSHCQTDGHRVDYVKELRKYIQVDTYGRCGNLSCPKGGECYTAMGKQYKFYLSFENVLCKDYVSEKFMKALAENMVPVTFGGADYTRFAPRGSYINALDFASPQQLAEHLKFLDSNDAEYNKYFDWRRSYGKPSYERMEHWVCQLCLKLMDPDEPVKVYHDLAHWWNTDSNCTYWDSKNVVKPVKWRV